MRVLPAIILLLVTAQSFADKVVHREKSLYGNLVVKEIAGKRCLVFSVRRQERNQTCIDIDDPNHIVFPYVQMVFSGLLVNPEPSRSLMIGMGGGTISNVLTEIYPDLTMDLVEVDQAVVKVATDYFGFRESDQVIVHVADGRVFTRRALLNKERYDLIILDAFTGDYIPEHLMTVEFLEDIKSLLTPGGVVIANTFWDSELYHHESVTYSSVFEPQDAGYRQPCYRGKYWRVARQYGTYGECKEVETRFRPIRHKFAKVRATYEARSRLGH